MTYSKASPTPVSSTSILSKFDGETFPNPSEYKSVVGALQYCMITMADIAYIMKKLCQFLSKPTIRTK